MSWQNPDKMDTVAAYRIEGQDASNGQVPATQQQVQPSVDALQEVSVLTSNFSAEYGQVGGGMFNYVVKSGSNSYHGSAYDYAVNEALNAAAPWVSNNARPRVRRHDYGFTVGGQSPACFLRSQRTTSDRSSCTILYSSSASLAEVDLAAS